MDPKSNKYLFFAGALAVPYLYYFFARPKLFKMEKNLDEKITRIDDKTLAHMIKKQELHKQERISDLTKDDSQDLKNQNNKKI